MDQKEMLIEIRLRIETLAEKLSKELDNEYSSTWRVIFELRSISSDLWYLTEKHE